MALRGFRWRLRTCEKRAVVLAPVIAGLTIAPHGVRAPEVGRAPEYLLLGGGCRYTRDRTSVGYNFLNNGDIAVPDWIRYAQNVGAQRWNANPHEGPSFHYSSSSWSLTIRAWNDPASNTRAKVNQSTTSPTAGVNCSISSWSSVQIWWNKGQTNNDQWLERNNITGVHELGHVFGLAHSINHSDPSYHCNDFKEGLMGHYNFECPGWNGNPKADDEFGVNEIYN